MAGGVGETHPHVPLIMAVLGREDLVGLREELLDLNCAERLRRLRPHAKTPVGPVQEKARDLNMGRRAPGWHGGRGGGRGEGGRGGSSHPWQVA